MPSDTRMPDRIFIWQVFFYHTSQTGTLARRTVTARALRQTASAGCGSPSARMIPSERQFPASCPGNSPPEAFRPPGSGNSLRILAFPLWEAYLRIGQLLPPFSAPCHTGTAIHLSFGKRYPENTLPASSRSAAGGAAAIEWFHNPIHQSAAAARSGAVILFLPSTGEGIVPSAVPAHLSLRSITVSIQHICCSRTHTLIRSTWHWDLLSPASSIWLRMRLKCLLQNPLRKIFLHKLPVVCMISLQIYFINHSRASRYCVPEKRRVQQDR